MAALVAIALLCFGCAPGGNTMRPGPSASPAVTAAPQAKTTTASNKLRAEPIVEPQKGEQPAAKTDEPKALEPKAPAKRRVFSVLDFEPPFPRSAQKGDGVWSELKPASETDASTLEGPIAFTTTVHPHKVSRFISMNIVALDLESLELHWVVGKLDHGAKRLDAHMTPGLVPESEQAQTLFVFNGGFKAHHGYWGVMSHDITLIKPRDTGCTVALTSQGVDISPWNDSEAPRSSLRAYRQTPPCLIHRGQIHPHLERGITRAWAGRNAKRKTRRRSAVGINEARDTLFYAIGSETEAVDLARGLLAAGASDAAQLDINWSWTRFLLIGDREGKRRVTATLVPETVHGKNEYFSWPSERDFFYLRRR